MHKTYKTLFTVLLLLTLTVSAVSQTKDIPNYSEKPRSEVPVEYTWKIEDIYANLDAWNSDKQKLASMIADIDAKAKTWAQSARNFYEMLKFMEEIEILSSKLSSYASFQNDMDMSNPLFLQMEAEIQQLYIQMGTKFSFFNNDLLKMDEKVLWSYFDAEPELVPFRHDIKNTLRRRKHILPEDQEKLISQMGLFSGTPSQASGFLRDVDMPPAEIILSDGTKINLNTANFMRTRGSKNPADRSLAMRTFFGNYKKYENTLASLLEGYLKHRVFNKRVRNYGSCLQARLYGENIDTNVYYTLIKNVNENLNPLHRFLKLKKELLGVDKFMYEDIYASSVKAVDKLYTYNEAKDLVINAMKPLGSEYVSNLERGFNSRWVDIYPNKGKQSGAYSGGVYGIHPFVKMNYNGNYNAVSTLAHELGHSMHSYFSSKNQTYGNAGYPTFLAEIASTFNENLMMDYLLKNETDDMFKLYILDSYLDGARGTIYRQTLFAEFELAMYRHVESGKSLSPEFLNKTYLELTRKYYGQDLGVTQVDDYIQSEWSYIPHFYRNYYVFQYSTGMLASMMLADRVLNNGGESAKSSIESYIKLLSSGGSDYPLELLKKAGVDMTSSEPYVAGLARFDNYVTEMEKIVARLKAAGKL